MEDTTAARTEVAELNTRINALTESLHRDEVAKAQAELRIEQLEQMVLEQFGMAGDILIAEYGPEVSLPPTALEMDEYAQARERGEPVTAPVPMPFDRPTQERRAKKAERELAELGRVNPLALEEFAALEERYNFLSTQLEDVKAARKDLLELASRGFRKRSRLRNLLANEVKLLLDALQIAHRALVVTCEVTNEGADLVAVESTQAGPECDIGNGRID